LKKVIGKPCEGKLQARFDEGVLETKRKFCASVLLYTAIQTVNQSYFEFIKNPCHY